MCCKYFPMIWCLLKKIFIFVNSKSCTYLLWKHQTIVRGLQQKCSAPSSPTLPVPGKPARDNYDELLGIHPSRLRTCIFMCALSNICTFCFFTQQHMMGIFWHQPWAVWRWGFEGTIARKPWKAVLTHHMKGSQRSSCTGTSSQMRIKAPFTSFLAEQMPDTGEAWVWDPAQNVCPDASIF